MIHFMLGKQTCRRRARRSIVILTCLLGSISLFQAGSGAATQALESSNDYSARPHLEEEEEAEPSQTGSEEKNNNSSRAWKSRYDVQLDRLRNSFQDGSGRYASPRAKEEGGDTEISRPVTTIRMIAIPPRDQVPGSTKGLPYKVRVIYNPRRRSRLESLLGRRGRQLFSQAGFSPPGDSKPMTYTVDLHGGIVGVGEYYSVIKIGGKKIRVQVDTGSSTLAVPMDGCVSCIKKANRYSVQESVHGRAVSCDSEQCAADRCTRNCAVCSERGACCSSQRPKDCGFSLRYADGSAASGSVVQDEVHWGSLKANVTFGGILRNSRNFERPQVDGILGMAYKSLACNPSCFDPPFDRFVKKGVVEDVFSICMTRTGGKLMLGGYEPRVARTAVRYTPVVHAGSERYYRVTLGGSLLVGTERVKLPNFRAAIVDTGTTLLVTSTRTFATLKEHFQRRFCGVAELCGSSSWFQSGMCVSLSDADLRRLPSLTLTVGGALRLELRARDYMVRYARGGRTYRCVGIMGMDGLGGLVVLGNTLMQRYVTVYDRRRGRLGFAEAARNCGDGDK